ncbi:hypothetical protein PEPIB1_13 (plasmid) [Tritonibacter mobilis]|nr:hypothetical protein PEPIB1_13 [Tritonibacter mobilis]
MRVTQLLRSEFCSSYMKNVPKDTKSAKNDTSAREIPLKSRRPA